MSSILFTVLWMYFGKVDVVVTARGIVIPIGEEKVIQSLDKGVVEVLSVKEGEFVKQGQVLAIISPAEHEPELELNNIREEERSLLEQIASNRSRLLIALSNKARLSEVRDIIPQPRYDEAVNEVNSLTHEINSLNARLSGLRNRRIQLKKQRQILKAPIDGYIGQVFVHTIGGVVTPAEKIMSLIPKDAPLGIKGVVMNQDIGFVKAGMPVSIKIDTYNFQKYGMLEGEIGVISPNSRNDERLGAVYDVYITLRTKQLTVEGKIESLKAGMSVTNEIKTGKRRIIEFFIYPLVKYLDESIKVR